MPARNGFCGTGDRNRLLSGVDAVLLQVALAFVEDSDLQPVIHRHLGLDACFVVRRSASSTRSLPMYSRIAYSAKQREAPPTERVSAAVVATFRRAVSTDILHLPARVVGTAADRLTSADGPQCPRVVERRKRTADDHPHDDHGAPSAALRLPASGSRPRHQGPDHRHGSRRASLDGPRVAQRDAQSRGHWSWRTSRSPNSGRRS